ncbi:hypothetical protein [Anaerovorax odorimutans]|uniref:hypothetical protein n=1 Tax=Anaerovorax odorimutans TaxID=109327 RepID=UPI000401FEEF|nr:hypothetical protein [Anaerovorax odorimutans]
MSELTKNLKLYKADPTTDGNDTFNIHKMLNENWDKIDTEFKTQGVTVTKLHGIRTIVSQTTNVNFMTGEITAFNHDTDDLEVSMNTTLLYEGAHYTINSDNQSIDIVDGVWEGSAEQPKLFYFTVTRNQINNLVFSDGQSIQDGTITKNKLDNNIADILENAVIATDAIPTEPLPINADTLDGHNINYFATTTDINNIESKVNNCSEQISSIAEDNAYQTPTIVDTQIIIQKQSNINRLYFKLDNDLNGDITISLDGGNTSLPLKDIDGVNVTSLDKGFVEVVYETSFFTYAPKKIIGANLEYSRYSTFELFMRFGFDPIRAKSL